MNKSADLYFIDGCGRCALYQTPGCKVLTWKDELALLRELVMESSLTEECKWGVPCYTLKGKNVLIISAFKESCVLSFFKGALMEDPHGLLTKPGEDTHEARIIRFRNMQEIMNARIAIPDYIEMAIRIEKAGLKVPSDGLTHYEPPDELIQKMEEMPDFKTAFAALTPGRKRGYLHYFTKPKKAETRLARIEKCIPNILQGKGLQDK